MFIDDMNKKNLELNQSKHAAEAKEGELQSQIAKLEASHAADLLEHTKRIEALELEMRVLKEKHEAEKRDVNVRLRESLG